MNITVKTQAALDQAIADEVNTIYLESEDGVWLTLNSSDSAHVVAGDSAHVVAWDSAHVEARGSAHVEAWDSAHVEAWDSAHVVAGSFVAVHLHSQRVELTGGVVIDMTAIDRTDPQTWCDLNGIKVADGIATVYKAVNDAYEAGQEWTLTSYAPGSTPEAADWRDDNDCGGGLHFGPTPAAATAYRTDATRWLQVGVALAEMRPIPGGTAKIKAPRVVVPCVEVDRYGKSAATADVPA